MVKLDQERLAGALRLARDKQSQRQIGDACGLAASTICRVERGRHRPSVEAFLAICEFLGRDPRDFVVR